MIAIRASSLAGTAEGTGLSAELGKGIEGVDVGMKGGVAVGLRVGAGVGVLVGREVGVDVGTPVGVAVEAGVGEERTSTMRGGVTSNATADACKISITSSQRMARVSALRRIA
jgi:hypothetical protein